MKKLLISIIAATSVLATGCSVRMADMTVASTKNYNLNSNQFVKGERVTGEDKVPVVLFPLGVPNFKTAVDRAIEKNRCAVALSDVVITQLNQAFIVGQIGYRVEGTQVIDRSQPECKK
ncbi:MULTISPECIES: hypothetical protein [unclassified Acinetobacter]|jgi:hypothetical protein|uniref:hypothetical protein n=1 Tax=unclassified Acinetobacter TaxID=196816 RepID=UPI0004477653|nr:MULTISPECIES: hypothetical protein [unclassified Acinetobacter]EZQ10090.1 hypothetical protein CL42_09095 [Acinetobacter sp. Ver3]SEL82967.1 hypothetical protein SAMN05216500_10649 [Acinetobacter sp. DSM 11652]